MNLLRITLICALVLFANASAHAQARFAACPEAATADIYALWGVQLVEDCDPTPSMLESLRPALASLLGDDGDIALSAKINTLQLMRERVLTLPMEFPAVSARSVQAFDLALQCDIHQLNFTSNPACSLYNTSGRALRLQKWQTLENSGSAFREVFLDVFDTLSPDCLGSSLDPASACHAIMMEQLMPVLELYNVMARVVLPAINRDVVESIASRYAANHIRWRSYVMETGFQYPWELVFNKRRNGGFEEVATAQAAPEQRWVLLHPTAGVYHSNQLADGNQTDLVGIVKLIGQKRWKYDADNKPADIMGLSLTATFADIQGIEDVGYGLMADYKGFSLGVSRHGNKQLVVLNVELQNLLSARPGSFRQWLEASGF